MKRVDLTNISVFETLLDFTVEGEYIDLHNNFDCTKIETEPLEKQVLFYFESQDRYFRLVFYKAKIFHFRLFASMPSKEKGLCFESLSKITAIVNNDGSLLQLPENAGFYEVEFVEEASFVIEAERVVLQESSKANLEHFRSLERHFESLNNQITEMKRKLADLENHSEADTKAFLTHRKGWKEDLANFERAFEQTQKQLGKLREEDRLLLRSAL